MRGSPQSPPPPPRLPRLTDETVITCQSIHASLYRDNAPVDLHLSKALFSLDPGNLQLHCFLGLGALFCCSFFCPLDQPCKMLQMVQVTPNERLSRLLNCATFPAQEAKRCPFLVETPLKILEGTQFKRTPPPPPPTHFSGEYISAESR